MAFAGFIAGAGVAGATSGSARSERKPKPLNCPGCGAALAGGNGCSYCRLGYREPAVSDVGFSEPVDWRFVVKVSP